MMPNFGIITNEVTVPLGAMPGALRSAAWTEVYKRTALMSVLGGLTGGALAYATATKKKRGRTAAYWGVGTAGATAAVMLLLGWRQIKAADELYDYMAGKAGGAADVFNLPTG